MQRITTCEPDDEIIEVAIEAMKGALTGEAPAKKVKATEEKQEESEEKSE